MTRLRQIEKVAERALAEATDPVDQLTKMARALEEIIQLARSGAERDET
jgi:hypothetical protein